ncbi:MAG: hypothetical protein GXP63_00060 [DPANN group archaeon]|nr:hypothetical protein [DPANN group archaeon]
MADPQQKTIDDVAEKEAKKLPKKEFPPQHSKPREISDALASQAFSQTPDDLEAKTETMWQTVKSFNAWDWVKIAGINLGGAILGGGILNLAATTGSYLVAHYFAKRKEGFTRKGVKGDLYMGGLVTAVFYNFLEYLHRIENPFLRWGAYLGISIPIFNIGFITTKYFIDNYNPKRLIKGLFNGETYKMPFKVFGHLAKTFFPALKAVYKWFALPMFPVLNYLPLQYNMPALAVNRVGYRYLLEKHSGETAIQDGPKKEVRPHG